MMNFTSKLLKRAPTTSTKRFPSKLPASVLPTTQKQGFSLLQNELEQHDFSDPLNATELQLKNPTQLENMNLWSTIAHTLDMALERDDSAMVFGEDVKFGGVFRCTNGLREKYGEVSRRRSASSSQRSRRRRPRTSSSGSRRSERG